ncbi:MAG: NAD(P)-dependent oxidoreductase [Bacteroidota bacterium]
MLTIGLIREGKIPADNRVALTPAQCKWINENKTDIKVIVQSSENRCFTNAEYKKFGVSVVEEVSNCDILIGIKEVPAAQLIPKKTYLFFSHTKKKQPYNQQLFKTLINNENTLIDFECFEHEDGQRIIGFGFFAGIVGAHNGIMCYGDRTGLYKLGRVGDARDYRQLIKSYFGLKLPNLRVAVTGSGRVAHGIVEVMNMLDIQEVESDEYLNNTFSYPVYVHLKGKTLYQNRETKGYQRENFHANPEQYDCLFEPFCAKTDILMNGIYWDNNVPRLFTWDTARRSDFAIKSIADITDDAGGSVPCNLGDSTISNPVYGVDISTGNKTAPYLESSIDVMAVGNLPNELPKDASGYFGEQILKYILDNFANPESNVIKKATILSKGQLTQRFQYLEDYAKG